MEHNDIEKPKVKWTTIIMMLLLAFAIIMQIKLVAMIVKDKEAIDQDPFVAGANRFDLENVNCYIDDHTSLHFNKTSSSFIIKREFKEQGVVEWAKMK